MLKGVDGLTCKQMVAVASIPAFFGVVAVVVVGLYLLHRRTELESTLLAVIGFGIVALYLTITIFMGLVDL